MFVHVSTSLLYIRGLLRELEAREQGITAVEYALMVAVVALLLVVGFFFLFTQIQQRFSTTASCVDNAPATCP
ncbi:MAG TPA: Flp family type IVb pilin [Actinomycetes bacterium]|jgi:Flp pilus assembly pilin Flp|nr:Flp family type IVb pilin [Actinomycetes bacterium]